MWQSQVGNIQVMFLSYFGYFLTCFLCFVVTPPESSNLISMAVLCCVDPNFETILTRDLI